MRTPGKQKLRGAIYGLYERRVRRSLAPDRIPRHIGVIIDGNRRWARQVGDPVSRGHEAGANKISEFLEWCDDVGVKVVTVWMLSTDNLTRPAEELEPLLRIIEQTVEELTAIGRWRIHPVGALDLLPGTTAEALKAAETATHDNQGMLVNVAVGYGGRRVPRSRCPSRPPRAAASGPRRRGAHRAAPVHEGPAGSGPGHPDVG